MSTDTTPRTTMNGKPVFTVPVKTVINFNSGFAAKMLADALTFSTGDACVYRCAFCYVPAQFQKLDRVRQLLLEHGLKHEDVVIRREHALDVMRAQLVHPNGTPKFADPADTRVIFASPAVDVAGNMDLVRETIAACKLILQYTHWHIRLLSKSNLLHHVAAGLCNEVCNDVPWPVTQDEIRARMIFGVSTGTLDDGIAAAFEQDTPRVSKRLESLRWLQEHGFRTFGMICPSLPQADFEGYLKFSREIVAAIRPRQVEHIWAEVINVRGESFTRTVDALEHAGYTDTAARVRHVATDPAAWERYNRDTFLAHVAALQEEPGKLRYLTYTTKNTEGWWIPQMAKGAVLL